MTVKHYFNTVVSHLSGITALPQSARAAYLSNTVSCLPCKWSGNSTGWDKQGPLLRFVPAPQLQGCLSSIDSLQGAAQVHTKLEYLHLLSAACASRGTCIPRRGSVCISPTHPLGRGRCAGSSLHVYVIRAFWDQLQKVVSKSVGFLINIL